jgi:hypothetical protein
MNISVPGDLAWSSLIVRVEEHQENIRALKQGSREHERTWNELATTRSLCAVFRTDLGEIPTLDCRVSNWRQERVDWMLEYLAEMRVCSIYRALERWPVNLRLRGGGQREGGALRKRLVAFTVASSPAITGYA